jgi:hypothetical protein
MPPSLIAGKTRQIDVYSRSFSRISRGGARDEQQRNSYNHSPLTKSGVINSRIEKTLLKPSKSLSLNRMTVRHQSRNPNQATTFHILAPAAHSGDLVSTESNTNVLSKQLL